MRRVVTTCLSRSDCSGVLGRNLEIHSWYVDVGRVGVVTNGNYNYFKQHVLITQYKKKCIRLLCKKDLVINTRYLLKPSTKQDIV